MLEILKTSEKHYSQDQLSRASDGLNKVLSNKAYGFWQVPGRSEVIPDIEAQAKRLQKFPGTLFLFGVGGSSLGPQFLNDLYSTNERHVVVIDNLDPVMLARQWGKPESLKNSSFLFISKSGSTMETLVSLQKLQEHLGETDPQWFSRALVISEDKKNALTAWAQSKSVPILHTPEDVGGRFSVLTSVGMLTASYLGQKASEFHVGAKWALENRGLAETLIAESLASFQRQEWITLFWSYSSMLKNFNAWMVQLWAESLGKRVDRQGNPAPRVSTPWTAIGATDQHSLLQQVIEGTRDKFVVLLRVKSYGSQMPFETAQVFPHLHFLQGKSLGGVLEAQAIAMGRALRQEQIKVVELELQDLSARSIGALLMTWQMVVAGLGTSLGIDPFNQPGVELGKRLALEILNP